MTTTAFDTLKYSKKLKAAGVPEKQAEVQAEVMAELIDERLITKHDLKELEYRLTIRLGSMMVVAVAGIAALVKIL